MSRFAGVAHTEGGVTGLSTLPVPPGGADIPQPKGPAGGLTVLNWAGFRAAISFTFDDANSSQIDRYDQLSALGVPFTFYLITGKPEASDATWARAIADGHELGNHTHGHSMTASGADVDAATDFIERTFGVDVWTMAAPFGEPTFAGLARTRFLINRGVGNGLMGANDDTDPFRLSCYIPPAGAAASLIDEQIDTARAAGKWRIVLVHGFNGGSDQPYQALDIEEFTSSVRHAQSLGDLWLDSVVNVGAYWRGQKAFSGATPTESGADRVWQWTLPAHFPPGRFLRVTVEGGTLKQGGAALEWDPHGYYEVALDVGSLTLSP